MHLALLQIKNKIESPTDVQDLSVGHLLEKSPFNSFFYELIKGN